MDFAAKINASIAESEMSTHTAEACFAKPVATKISSKKRHNGTAAQNRGSQKNTAQSFQTKVTVGVTITRHQELPSTTVAAVHEDQREMPLSSEGSGPLDT